MKELDFLIDPKYFYNYKNGIPFLFEEKIPIVVSWDEIFSLADEDIIAKADLKKDHYNGYGMRIQYADRILKISQVVNKISNIFVRSKFGSFEGPSCQHHIYVSLTTLESLSNAPHTDDDCVFFWSIQGNALWQIWDKDKKEIEYSFELSPGQVVYCPAYRQHNVVSLSPRSGVSLGFRRLRETIGGTI
jgi:mannose-6-phosphate isomerase-like protein (cupin superfamily)